MTLHLSKSKYCSAVQCPKMLWLQKNKPQQFDDSSIDQVRLESGSKVGDLAMSLFGDFTEVPYGDLSDMLCKTSELIEQNVPVIAEASFSCSGLFCSVDILKKSAEGYEIYEVKSSAGIKDIYIDDAAYQNYVLTQCKLHISRVCIVYVNTSYTRSGKLDLQELFTIEDITEAVNKKLPEVEENIRYFRNYMLQTDEPADDIGLHCSTPYECGFWKYCTRHLPQPNVFDVKSRLQIRKKFKLYRNGSITFADLVKCKLTSAQKMQLDHELNELPPHIEKDQIRNFLKNLSYPLYFLDFESFQQVIPQYDDSRPYEQITFQYSLHFIAAEGGELQHTEFLAHPGTDPRRELAEQLCCDIPENVCTIAYNAGFEKGRIARLAELYPDLKDHLMNIYVNIQDLMIPFQQKHYYSRAMNGSYSIKAVLPAIFPDDPALDYHNLEGVHNGGEASDTFARMAEMSSEELAISRKQLLKYCELDTFAMVKIWQKLKELTAN